MEKLRAMNHSRMLCLVHSAEAPLWFLKLAEGFADSIRRGEKQGLPRLVKPLAQRMWDDITEGFDAQDEALAAKYEQVSRGTRVWCEKDQTWKAFEPSPVCGEVVGPMDR